jgi:hypothetical protein
MADIFYHGAKGNKHQKTPREESRAETLRVEMMILENQRMQKLVIGRERLIPELDRIEAHLLTTFEQSALSNGAKEELKRIWFTTRKTILSSRTDFKTLLKAARAGEGSAGEPNGDR